MSNNDIREPIQKRSIEKKNRIIQAGFNLICEKGYHNTNTAEIAKEAGVSTGIIYSYFKDKKDILLHGLMYYSNSIMVPVFNKLSAISGDLDLENIIRELIKIFIESHNMTKSAHEEVMAMSHSDDDVGKIFRDFEIETGNRIVEYLERFNIKPENAKEKVHVIYGIVENLCHEIVYHKHEGMNYGVMTDIVVETVMWILN